MGLTAKMCLSKPLPENWELVNEMAVTSPAGHTGALIRNTDTGIYALQCECVHWSCAQDWARANDMKRLNPAARYAKKNIRQFVIKVNHKTNPEVVSHLEARENVQGYIISLVENDMKKEGAD